MNEETFLSDFQLEFTPPQPHNINLNTPTTSSGSSSSSEDEDGPPIQIIPLDNPPPNIMAQQAAVSGGQLSSIPQYSGNQGLEGLVYAEAIDRAKTQFNWTEAQASTAAISRGGNAVSNWIRGEKAAGLVYNNWNNANPGDNDRNLREPFLLRFGPKYTTGGAVAAISDLKQRSGETVGSFMDRVKISVDMLNYNVEEDDRNQAFRDAYVRLVIAQFGSGLHEEIREKVFGVATPPATIEEVLQAATAIENEKHSKATKLVVNLVDEDKDKNKEAKDKPADDPITVLQDQMKEVLAITKRGGQGFRGRGRGRGQGSYSSYRCYGCGQLGHIREHCTSANQAPFRGRGGRGGGGYNSAPHMTRRGQFRSNFGSNRGRPIFPVSDFGPQYQGQQDWSYENYWPEHQQEQGSHHHPEHGYQQENWGQNGSGNDYWGGF